MKKVNIRVVPKLTYGATLVGGLIDKTSISKFKIYENTGF